MKKYINIAFIYAILGLVFGVFYREFTKLNDFTAKTTLAFTHVHLLVLGMIMFLIVALFTLVTNLESQKQFKQFLIFYNIGLPFTVIMLTIRGVIQVLNIELTTAMSASISGLAGIAHVIMTIGLVLLFIALRKSEKLKA